MIGTFEAQVESIIGIDITGSTTPTQDQLTQFLREGVIDVTKKCIEAYPGERDRFLSASGPQTTQGWQNNVDIVSVVREDGVTAGNYRPCRRVPVALQSQVVDTESLSFASKYHPVYMQDEDGKVSVFPAPDSSPDRYKIYYVNEVPQNASAAQLSYAHSDLGHFPDDKLYLVVIYASMRSLEAAATSKTVAQDIELQQSYGQLAANLKQEYMLAFQTQQQTAGPPAR